MCDGGLRRAIVAPLVLLVCPLAWGEIQTLGFRGHVEAAETRNVALYVSVGDAVDGFISFDPARPDGSVRFQLAFDVPADPEWEVRRERREGLSLEGLGSSCAVRLGWQSNALALFSGPPGYFVSPFSYGSDLIWGYAPESGFDCGRLPVVLPSPSAFTTGNVLLDWLFEDVDQNFGGQVRLDVRIDQLYEIPEICWAAVEGTTEYEVARAHEPRFSSCRTQFVTAPCFRDVKKPHPGGIIYYLARSAAPSLGGWGVDGAGMGRDLTCDVCDLQGGASIVGSCASCGPQRESCEQQGGIWVPSDPACPVYTSRVPRFCVDDPSCGDLCSCNGVNLVAESDSACDWADGRVCLSVSQRSSRCALDLCAASSDPLEYRSIDPLSGSATLLNLRSLVSYGCALVSDSASDAFDCKNTPRVGDIAVAVRRIESYPACEDGLTLGTDNVPDDCETCSPIECEYDCTAAAPPAGP